MMVDDDRVTFHPQLHGDAEARWLVGEYDTNPVHGVLTPELLARLANGDAVADAHLPRLAAIATAKVEGDQAQLAWREADRRGMLVLTIDEADWDQAPPA